jgi:hypothetical protein
MFKFEEERGGLNNVPDEGPSPDELCRELEPSIKYEFGLEKLNFKTSGLGYLAAPPRGNASVRLKKF